ncbi:pilus assembly protein TadG-related protein [Sphingomonas floccifaciens]|uniref:pilus assembly protein TadG-related protein n=1 Tax=Sphingomonas floccifaciens TaxID=1844115 RepID=UPI0036D431B6
MRDDRRGSVLPMIGAGILVLVGVCGLGAEGGSLYLTKQRMQSASDTAALGAATALSQGGSYAIEAKGLAASYGFQDTVAGTTVVINKPPSSGSYAGIQQAVEVIIEQPQSRLFSGIWGGDAIAVSTRSVAVAVQQACVLALNRTASGAVSLKGNSSMTLRNCSVFANSTDASSISVGGTASISAYSASTSGGISGVNKIVTTRPPTTYQPQIADPYATRNFAPPTSCSYNGANIGGSMTLSAGVICGDVKLNAGSDITLNPGVYYMVGGTLSVNGGAKLSGSGVTIVYTTLNGSSYGRASFNGGAAIDISPPTSGPTAGIVFFGDRTMPAGTQFFLSGGASQSLKGAIYLSKGDLTYAGGAGTSVSCTQIVADTISFVGNSDLEVTCPGFGTNAIGGNLARLVE